MVFNSFLFFVSILFYLGCVVGLYKLFGKTGLYIWTAFSAILCSIEVLVQVNMLGMTLTLGNALYASSFLVTDILSEKFEKESAIKAVNIGLATTFIWVCSTQLIIAFIPNEYDFIMPALKEMFGLVPRMSIASIFTYAVTQRVDVFLYHWIWDKTGKTNKFLWLRNNGSTLISQFLDTVIFTLVAFLGTYSLDYMVSLCLCSYLIKAIVAVCDTPFVYLARKLK